MAASEQGSGSKICMMMIIDHVDADNDDDDSNDDDDDNELYRGSNVRGIKNPRNTKSHSSAFSETLL